MIMKRKTVKKVKHVVKRMGHLERFDERKVYASCYAACLSSHMQHINAEKVCEKVTRNVRRWVHSKELVTSNQIFRETGKELRKHSKDAAFMYRTHRDIS